MSTRFSISPQEITQWETNTWKYLRPALAAGLVAGVLALEKSIPSSTFWGIVTLWICNVVYGFLVKWIPITV